MAEIASISDFNYAQLFLVPFYDCIVINATSYWLKVVHKFKQSSVSYIHDTVTGTNSEFSTK